MSDPYFIYVISAASDIESDFDSDWITVFRKKLSIYVMSHFIKNEVKSLTDLLKNSKIHI